jgi:hypothetical protein
VVSPPPGTRPELDQLRSFPNDVVVLLRNKKILAAVQLVTGSGVIDKPVSLAVLDNGPETVALLMAVSGAGVLAPMTPGKYTLTLSLSRKRWRDSSSADPEAEYSQQQVIQLIW